MADDPVQRLLLQSQDPLVRLRARAASQRAASAPTRSTPTTPSTPSTADITESGIGLTGGAETGAARRAFDPEGQREWHPDTPFPQIAPTSTIDPSRPRTLEAGYDPYSQILRVRFRDGTPWEYRNVERRVWTNFRRAKSPGRFINRVLNFYPYGRGDF